MSSLTVSPHVKELVLNVTPAVAVEAEDLVGEALPLSLCVFRIVFAISIVGSIDQTEIGGSL